MDVEQQGNLIASLRKSKTRRNVLEYLIDIRPKRSYPSEISRSIKIQSTDVCGALKGVPKRFKEENSLTALGLVEKIENEGKLLYRATPLGCKTWWALNE
ncbi:MAG: archaellum operon transcriptional activator EarA family protein [Euryarchaeota archaeon]|nr:archaellum operon transcriptional activator EarA family protein [Euryarchaeota archaeon]